MKNKLLLIITVILISCGSGKEECISKLQKNGYTNIYYVDEFEYIIEDSLGNTYYFVSNCRWCTEDVKGDFIKINN